MHEQSPNCAIVVIVGAFADVENVRVTPPYYCRKQAASSPAIETLRVRWAIGSVARSASTRRILRTMLPFAGLWFTDRTVEARFLEYVHTKEFRRSDRTFALVNGAICTWKVISCLQDYVVADTTKEAVVVAISLGLLAVTIHAQIRSTNTPPHTLADRPFYVAVLGCIYSLGWASLGLTPASRNAILSSLWRSGPVFLCCNGLTGMLATQLGAPLLVRNQVVVQGLLLLAVYTVIPTQYCSVVSTVNSASRTVMVLWTVLDMLNSLIGTLLPLGTGEHVETGAPDAFEACRHYLLFSYVVVGCLVPLYSRWVREYRMRCEFLMTEPRDVQKLEAREFEWCNLEGSMIFMHVIVFVLWAAGFWLVTNPMPNSECGN